MTLISRKTANKRIGVAEGKFKVPDVMPVSAEELSEYCEQSGFQKILIREKHVFALANLKREENAPPHKDPFDRMLICQASTENMMFITHDSLIPGYNEPCILVV